MIRFGLAQIVQPGKPRGQHSIIDEREEGLARFHKFRDMLLLSLRHIEVDVLSRN